MWPPFLKSRFGGQGAYWTRLWPEGSKGSEGSGGRFLGLTGPMGRRVLKFDGPLARGLWYRPAGDEFYKPPAAVTSTSSIIIRITTVHPFATSWPSSPKGDARTLRDWLSVSYGMIRILVIGSLRSPPQGKTPKWYVKYMTRCLSPQIPRFPLRGTPRRGKGCTRQSADLTPHRYPDRQSAAPPIEMMYSEPIRGR